MQVSIKGSDLNTVRDSLLDNAIDYFKSHFKYGGFMYENFERDFLLPYTSKVIIKNRLLSKEWGYEVDLDSLLHDYLFYGDSSYFGNRQLETARDIWVAVRLAQDTGGELRLDTREISLLDDIMGGRYV